MQRIGGLLIAILSGAGLVWIWYTVVTEFVYYPRFAMIAPAFMIVGLGLLIFGGYREEREKRGEDISKLSGLKLLTSRWWAILIVAIIAGLINFVLITIYPAPFR